MKIFALNILQAVARITSDQDISNSESFPWTIFLGTFSILLVYFSYVGYKSRFNFTPSELPQYQPPFSLSPGAMRYIYQGVFDTKCLIVAIIHANIKGCYHITWGKNKFMAEINEKADMDVLSTDEKFALSYNKNYFIPKIIIRNKYSGQTIKMSNRMYKSIENKYRFMFNQKHTHLTVGIILSIISTLFSFTTLSGIWGTIPVLGYILILVFGICMPIYLGLHAWHDNYTYGLIFAVVIGMFSLYSLYKIDAQYDGPSISLFLLPLAFLNYIAYRVLPIYSQTGQQAIREILAYRTYLKNKINDLETDLPIEQTFAQELPYMLALDIDHQFTQYFENALTTMEYSPFRVFQYVNP